MQLWECAQCRAITRIMLTTKCKQWSMLFTLLYYWLSQRSQDKISTSMVWLSLTLYNTNKTKYMNVMSEILKAGWLELQLVTDVLGMSPLAGNKTGFPLLTVVLITHTTSPIEPWMQVQSKNIELIFQKSDLFWSDLIWKISVLPDLGIFLYLFCDVTITSYVWSYWLSRKFPNGQNIFWSNSDIEQSSTHMKNRAKPEPLTSPH